MRLAFQRFFRKVRRALHLGPVPLEAVLVSTAPSVLRGDTVYLLTEDNDPWTVLMRCPCGCSEVLFMSLIEGSPRWTHELHSNGTVSLRPSIWRTTGCKSHFFLRKGFVSWCRT